MRKTRAFDTPLGFRARVFLPAQVLRNRKRVKASAALTRLVIRGGP